MAIEIITNKLVDLGDELLKLKQQWNRDTLLKSLFSVAAIIMGIATIIFLSSVFSFIGIAMIVIASVALYQYFENYMPTMNIFNRAATAITQHFSSL